MKPLVEVKREVLATAFGIKSLPELDLFRRLEDLMLKAIALGVYHGLKSARDEVDGAAKAGLPIGDGLEAVDRAVTAQLALYEDNQKTSDTARRAAGLPEALDFEQWQKRYGPPALGFDLEQQRAGWEGALQHALGLTPPNSGNEWPLEREAGRQDDMNRGHLRVGLDSDNDVYVSVFDGEHRKSAGVEFCNPGGCGGGRSSRTRAALIALMVAIEADNAERPDLAFPRKSACRGDALAGDLQTA